MHRIKGYSNRLGRYAAACLLTALMAGCGSDKGNGSAGSGGSAAAVNLGSAANFAILAKTGVSTVPPSVVTGNVGLSPAARIFLTGWSEASDATDTFSTSSQVVAPGKLFAADYVGGTTSADLTTAVGNMQTAYTDAAGRAAGVTELGSGNIGGLTLTPGVYKWGTALSIPTNVTLTGSATDVWIFQIAGGLTQAAATTVVLGGAAQAKNIFWQVAGGVTLGATAHLEGNVLSQTAITLGNKASVNGRLLAQTAVTLDASTVTQPAP